MPAAKPLPEGLLEAVRETPHMTALLQRMGLPLTGGERNRMRELLKRRGIDTTHWCHSPTHRYSDEALQAAVAASTSRPVCCGRWKSRSTAARTRTWPDGYAQRGSTRRISSGRHTTAVGRRPGSRPLRSWSYFRKGPAASTRTYCAGPWLPAESRNAVSCAAWAGPGRTCASSVQLPCTDSHLVPQEVRSAGSGVSASVTAWGRSPTGRRRMP